MYFVTGTLPWQGLRVRGAGAGQAAEEEEKARGQRARSPQAARQETAGGAPGCRALGRLTWTVATFSEPYEQSALSCVCWHHG